MQAIIMLVVVAGVGWFVIQILPFVLPIIGYATVGAIALAVLASIFNK